MSTLTDTSKAVVTDVTKYKILVIDDNAAIHNDFRKIFSKNEELSELDDLASVLFDDAKPSQNDTILYELDSAYQGEEGYEKVLKAQKEKNPYTLAFVDMRMPPGWDGLQTIEKIWEADPDLHIIICTAYADYSWKEIFERLGQSDRLLILKKPFDNAELCQMAAAMCEKRRLFGQVQLRMEEMEEVILDRTKELQLVVQEKDRDACELKQTLQELRQAQATLLHVDKLASVGQLAAGIAHEINTPVQFVGDNIRACSEMFEDAMEILAAYQILIADLEKEGLYLEQIESIHDTESKFDLDYIKEEVPLASSQSLDGVERVRTIVKAMKDFSHGGGVLDQPIAFDLNTAIESTLTVARNEIKYVSNVETDFGNIPTLRGYPNELNQVFLNLFVNAAHAIEAKQVQELGTVKVQTAVEGKYVVISISDTGCGMPEEVKKKIFDPFFTTKEVGKGTGQGLAITHNIVVEKHGGRIEVDSIEGEGTTFRIYLALDESES
ncbi:ATP-binding protein [uncultured Gimesia sp.]|uniref:ATP-binding protein n=1 Tax=uncultured Gimesia sp. TaxID=1678688 RepID=UPI0030DA9BA5|tara:strand:+ start:19094 stop:20581 length:1488 start_codon:yes stop_codon:yes gene_type:complete